MITKISSRHRTGQVAALSLTGALLFAGTMPAIAVPAKEYTVIDQAKLTAVSADSVETVKEGANGPIALVLDGKKDTYWHTKWWPQKDPVPHNFVIKLGDTPVEKLGRIALTPRQSSNGSGRVNAYEVFASAADPTCKDEGKFVKVAAGAFSGEVTGALQDRNIDFEPITAQCVKVIYKSAWGGKDGDKPVSPAEDVASLAEFNAFTVGEKKPEEATPAVSPLSAVVPDGVLTIGSDALKVRLHPKFPQVVDYSLGGKTVLGSVRPALTSILVNEKEQQVSVGAPTVTADTASYPLTFPGLAKVSMKAEFKVAGKVVAFELKDIVDPGKEIRRIRIPNQDIVTLDKAVPNSQISAQSISVNRAINGDSFEKLSDIKEEAKEKLSYRVLANTDAVAVAFTNNAVEDNTAKDAPETVSRVKGDSSRWSRSYRKADDRFVGSIWSGTWTYRGSTSDLGIGADPNPSWKLILTTDRNGDKSVDWQDGAIAFRDIRPKSNGMDEVANKVITRIPFNIVSQATHPFLRTLDDTKRVALATDNLGQQVMLKGYEAEGHDSAHPDYASHYNTRAGGLADMKTLVNEGANWNANFGVHVNTTESYSEARNFSEDLLIMPPQKAWGWMNQSYYIDQAKDLGTGNVLKRFADFRKEVPENLDWIYIDVFYPNGWNGTRLGLELQKQGWKLGSEWSDKFSEYSLWSHWSQEEKYGGTTNKGINSQIFRFMENSNRDTFNPDPILGNTNLVDFEGWTGHVDYNAFIKNVWQRNLPTKFLQRSPIVKWESNKVTFANGTVASSPDKNIDGDTLPTNRTITFEGVDVYRPGGSYLLPWFDGGSSRDKADGRNRLYHFNPAGGASTWKLPASWAGYSSLKLYQLGDNGKVFVGDVAVSGGSVSLSGIKAATAYVLYPGTAAPKQVDPSWGQGSKIADPGFFSGTLDAYKTSGEVAIETSNRANRQVVIKGGKGSLSQELKLPAGTWSAWAWVEVENGKRRPVQVSASGDGVKPTKYQEALGGVPTTSIVQSTALNATASDEKLKTYFQRVRVTFTSTGQPVTFKVAAGDGDALVRVDDLRVVPWSEPKDDKPTAQTVWFDDFENVDTGYWPFVTGKTNAGGDARTQLAQRHEPYSQKGWWGVDPAGKVVKGGKVIDNVLAGNWSLMAHEENRGEVLRTIDGSLINFKPGHKYRISFDYQNAYAGAYAVTLNYDSVAGGKAVSTVVNNQVLAQQRNTTTYKSPEFVASSCGRYWLGINKLKDGAQTDLVIDSMRVEDLGATGDSVACLSGDLRIADGSTHLKSGKETAFKSIITNLEGTAISGVKQVLSVPQGWTIKPATMPADKLAADASLTTEWVLIAPQGATSGEVKLVVTYNVDVAGKQVSRMAEFKKTISVIAGINDGLNYLSDLPFEKGTSGGWGPVERDMDTGEQGANDGKPIALGGKEFAKGLGANSPATINFELEGKCNRFTGLAGVQDGYANPAARRGTVTYSVLGDGKVLYGPSAVVSTKPVGLDVKVKGVKKLSVVIGDGGDGPGSDHAVIANAAVVCGDPAIAIPEAQDVTLTGSPDKPLPQVSVGKKFLLQARVFEPGVAKVELVSGDKRVALADLSVQANWRGEHVYTVPADFPAGEALVRVTQAATPKASGAGGARGSRLPFAGPGGALIKLEAPLRVLGVGEAPAPKPSPKPSDGLDAPTVAPTVPGTAPGAGSTVTAKSLPSELSQTGSPTLALFAVAALVLLLGGGVYFVRLRCSW